MHPLLLTKTLLLLLIMQLLSSMLSDAQQPKFVYAKGLKNSANLGGNVVIHDVKLDNAGNTYVIGEFEGIADFDPSVDSADLESEGTSDIFMAKYDAQGRYVFAHRFGDWFDNFGNGLVIGSAGSIHITGAFKGTVDFDPGANTMNLSSPDYVTLFIAGYDAQGNYLYAKSLTSTGNVYGNSIAADAVGNIYVTGYFTGTVDFDPGEAVASFTSPQFSTDIFIAKYDAVGNYMYAKTLGGALFHTGRASSIFVNASGSVAITGNLLGTIDFDPGPGTANVVGSIRLDDIFLARYDADGNFIYAKAFAGFGFDQAKSVILDNASNAYITGNISFSNIDFNPGNAGGEFTSSGGTDGYLASYDPLGNYRYANLIGGLESDGATGIALDGALNVYVTGAFQGSVDFDPTAATAIAEAKGGSDVFVAKYNNAGDFVYVNTMGGELEQTGTAIATDPLGNLRVVGTFYHDADFDPGSGEVILSIKGHSLNSFISALGTNGQFLWARQMGFYSDSTYIDRGTGIVADSTGNIFITGSFYGTLDFDTGPGVSPVTSAGVSDVFVAHYDRAGNLVKVFSIGGVGFDRGGKIVLDGDGNIVITGDFAGTVDFDPGPGITNLTSDLYTTPFVAKYNRNGNLIFAKAVAGGTQTFNYGLCIDKLQNIYLTGSFTGTADFDPGPGTVNLTSAGASDIFVAKYNQQGNLIYAKNYGGTANDRGAAVVVDDSGNFNLTGTFIGTVNFGSSFTINSKGASDIFLCRFDAAGNIVFSQSFGSNNADDVSGIAVNRSGDIYILGEFWQTVDFDPGPGTANLTSAGASDIFIARYNKLGEYLSAISLKGNNNDEAFAIQVDEMKNIFVSGSITSTVDFDPGAGEMNLSSHAWFDGFFAKYDSTGKYVLAKLIGGKGFDYCYDLSLDAKSNIYLTGSFQRSIKFNPVAVPEDSVATSINIDDIFFAKYGTSATQVRVESFTVTSVFNGDAVRLTWSTLDENNNAYFDIEKSKDTLNFVAINRAPGCDSCNGLRQYQLYDNEPLVGKTYYRLKQVDDEGNIFYSEIRSITIEKLSNSTVHILSSITPDKATVVINNAQPNKQVTIQLRNTAGGLLTSKRVILSDGNNFIPLNLQRYSTGIYFLVIFDNNMDPLFTGKIVKN